MRWMGIGGRNSRMTEQSSSLVSGAGQTSMLRRVAGFVLRPRLPGRVGRFSPAALRDTLKLYGIDMALMGLMLGAFLAVEMSGFEMPSNEFESIELGFAWIAVIVVTAPLAEELAFRGWLSGTLGAMLGSPIAALGCFLIAGAILAPAYVGMMWAGAVLVASGAGLAYWLRNHGPYRWFVLAFPALFWLGALAFAAIHLGNYEDTEQMLWPLVIPQFLAGILFAYARVTHGLLSSILLHMLHNGTFVALVLVGEAMV